MSPDYAIRAGWAEALDGMEADLEADRLLIEQSVLPSQPTSWEAPQHLGPIPIELRERAARILGELAQMSKRMTELKDATGRQLGAVRSIPSARDGASVYLDVAG